MELRPFGDVGYVLVMRWQSLFADLEGQAHALARADEDAEVAERIRGELATLTVTARLRGLVDAPVMLTLGPAGDLAGHLTQVGADWLLLECPDEVLVPVDALTTAWDLPARAVTDAQAGAVATRLRLGSALRAIARDRSAVVVRRRDGSDLCGTPSRVGLDFVDMDLHERGTAPRRTEIRRQATIPYAAIAWVRKMPGGWG